LSVLTFELLTGRPPYSGDNPISIIMQHVNAPIPSASARALTAPPEVDRVLRRGMAKDPAERYATAGEFASELRRLLPATTPATAPPEPARSSGRRAVLGVAALGGLAVVAGGGLLYVMRSQQAGDPQRLPAGGGPAIGERLRVMIEPVRDRLGPPTEPLRNIRAIEQGFQRGFVLVTFDPAAVYLVSNGSWERPVDRIAGLDWPAGQSPPGGVAAREQILRGVPGLQNRLGAPSGPADALPSALHQRFQNGLVIGVRPQATFALLDDGTAQTLRPN
jgi:hypothetical protein